MPAESQRRFAWVGAAVLIVGLGLAWAARQGAPAEASHDVNVFAAASLRDVMYEIGSTFSLSVVKSTTGGSVARRS